MSTTLLLVRHGQTTWNTADRWRGQSDVPLNDTGRAQADAAGVFITAHYQPQVIYTSALNRALETALAIGNRCNLPVQVAPGLLDISFGKVTGLTWQESQAQYPVICQNWMAAPHTVIFPEGESLSDVRARCANFIWSLCDDHADRQVVLVSHLVVCRVLLCYLLGLPESTFWRFELDTASLSVLRLDGSQVTLVKTNENCYLPH